MKWSRLYENNRLRTERTKMTEWEDYLNVPHQKIDGQIQHFCRNEKFGHLSTTKTVDTGKWESCFVTPDDKYLILQKYENADKALEGHKFWSNRLKNGFIPTESLEEEDFGPKEFIVFLEAVKNGTLKVTPNEKQHLEKLLNELLQKLERHI